MISTPRVKDEGRGSNLGVWLCLRARLERSEEVGHDAYLRHSHMTLVCNYAATRSKECHLRV